MNGRGPTTHPILRLTNSPWLWKPLIWVFPKIVVPQNGWFVMENHIKMDDWGVLPTGSPSSKRATKKKTYRFRFPPWLGSHNRWSYTNCWGSCCWPTEVRLQTSPAFSLMMNQIITWWFNSWPSLAWLSDPFKWLSGLQLGDENVTLNHLMVIQFVTLFGILKFRDPLKWLKMWPPMKKGMKFGHELNHLVKNGCFSKHHQLRER